MKLPFPAMTYTHAQEVQRNAILEAEDRRTMKRDQDIEVSFRRLLLTSPDGTRWSLTVDDTGTLATDNIDVAEFDSAFSTAFE